MEKPEMQEQQTGNKFADGLLMPIFAVVAVFVFIVLCFYAYNHVIKNKNNEQVAVLDGDNKPFKFAPQEPGGMEVRHTDKEVFNTVTGQQEKMENNNVNVENQEIPVTQEQLATKTENTNDNASPQTNQAPVITVSSGGEESDKKSDSSTSKDISINIDQEPDNNVNKTKTANENIEEPQAQASSTQEQVSKENDIKKEAASAVPQKSEEVVLKDSDKVPSKVKEKSADIKKAKSIKAEVKKETDKKTGETKTVIEFKEMPKSMMGKNSAGISSSSGGGDYFVQIGSYGSNAEAESSWDKFKTKYSAEIANHNKVITQVIVNGKTYFRLGIGSFADKSAASTQCGILKAKGQDCLIQKY